MKSVKKVIVRSDSLTNDTITHGSLTLYLDASYRPEHNARQWGVVEADFKDLKKGEKVWFHYLSLDEEDMVGEKLYRIDYGSIYCVIRDSRIVVLNDYVLVNIIEEETVKTTLIVPDHLKKEKLTMRGIVRATNHPQLIEGDEILFRKLGAFENEIEGTTYYVMESRDLLAKIK